MKRSLCSQTLFVAATLTLSLGTSGCLMSAMLGGVAKMKIVDTGRPNPEGTNAFLRGARKLGCTDKVTNSSSMGAQLWVDCPGGTFEGVPGKMTFGFGEDKKNLTIGCDDGDRVHCHDPINVVLAAADEVVPVAPSQRRNPKAGAVPPPPPGTPGKPAVAPSAGAPGKVKPAGSPAAPSAHAPGQVKPPGKPAVAPSAGAPGKVKPAPENKPSVAPSAGAPAEVKPGAANGVKTHPGPHTGPKKAPSAADVAQKDGEAATDKKAADSMPVDNSKAGAKGKPTAESAPSDKAKAAPAKP